MDLSLANAKRKANNRMRKVQTFNFASQVLIFTRPHEIRGIGINESDLHVNVIPPISLPDVARPSHLDFVAARREIYWSEKGSSQQKIMRFIFLLSINRKYYYLIILSNYY